jgi:phytoene synthase
MDLNEQVLTSYKSSVPLSPGIASPNDYDYCRTVMRNASQRYSFASTFLPSMKRKHVEALYAFLRVGDDRVDVSHSGFSSPEAAIDDWEAQYHHAFETGDSAHPVVRAYLDTAIQFEIPKSVMSVYFRAMRDDVRVSRFTTFGDLMKYIEGSAIPVGRAMTHILGVRKPNTLYDALPFADRLSIAMQLSNFLRDVNEDFELGRIYLPLEDLDRFCVSENDFYRRRVTPQFVDLMEFEIDRTEKFYSDAKPGVSMLASGRWGVMSGLLIYRAILDDIRRNNYDVFARKADISLRNKILLVGKSFWLVSTNPSI